MLFSKDQEMSQFIEGFDQNKRDEEEQMSAVQRFREWLLAACCRVSCP